MKSIVLLIVTTITLLFLPNISFGQIVLGPDASKFVLYTSSGAVSDNAVAHSHLTGDVGTSTVGPITGFGNVNGVMHPGADVETALCNTDLLSTIGQINAAPATLFPSGTMGSGTTFTPGVYSIPGNATLTLDLTLDGQSDPNSEFIIKIGGTFGTNTNSRVILTNGALACHVYWQITGAVTMASLSTMRGNIISGGAITMGSGDSLEGRAFSTVGLISIDGITAFTPVGCGSSVLTGPPLPSLASIACYTIFSSNGALANTAGTSTIIGDVGKNNDGSSITGWAAGDVTGTLHSLQDPSTIQAAVDLSKLYDTLNAMVPDIELLYPADFGKDLTLTPHIYVMNGATMFTDSLYLDAQGNPNGVFVIKIIGGALTTSTYSKVKLINGAQSRNVFWMVQGAVSINNYSVFRGTIVVPVGALNLVNTGVVLDGRALTMSGAITTEGLSAANPPSSFISSQLDNQIACVGSAVTFSVAVAGSGITYQWRKGNVNIVNGPNISGATSDTLKINPVSIADTASNYNVIITGDCSPSDTSNNASLIVNAGPNITIEPVNQVSCAGGAVAFFVKATGQLLTYQWRKGNVNLVNGLTISGATSDTLKINSVTLSDTASNYNVLVSGICLPKDTSINVSLLLNDSTKITAQPVNQSSCAGSPVLFTVKATGAGLTYQWRKGNVNVVNGLTISGATSDSLKINPASIGDTSSNYNVIISSTCSPKDTSLNASLFFNDSTIITTQPVNQSSCAGSPVLFTVKATGSGLTYQWRKGNVNVVNGLTISGATSDSLKINPASIGDTASNYNVIISSTCSPKDTSLNASLFFNGSTIITAQPVNQIVCAGNSAMFIIKATGSGLTYQWRRGNVNVVNGLNISGATNDTLKINPTSIADTASNYNVIISSTCSPRDTSLMASLILNTAPFIIIEPTDQVSCSGNVVRFSIVAQGTGLTYQWRKGTVNLNDGINISGTTSDTLVLNTVSIADTASNYNVVISGTCSPRDTSINVSLTVKQTPVAVANSNSPVCIGSAINLTAQTVSGATYEWSGPNGYVSLVQNPVILVATALHAGVYSLTVSNNGCNSLPSTTSIIVRNCDSADLSIVKTVDNAHPVVGSSVVFTIVATNNGPYTATGINVFDTLQNGYSYVSSSVTKGNYNPSTGIWSIDTLNNGATATLTITAIVNTSGNYINTATIKGDGVDTVISNNISWVETFPTDFFIPEGFSPNGDGINDLFVIRGIGAYPNNTFTVFNRWGNEVFNANPYKSTWDGSSSMGLRIGGDGLPVGTYFYILDLGDGSKVIKGTIYLNK